MHQSTLDLLEKNPEVRAEVKRLLALGTTQYDISKQICPKLGRSARFEDSRGLIQEICEACRK